MYNSNHITHSQVQVQINVTNEKHQSQQWFPLFWQFTPALLVREVVRFNLISGQAPIDWNRKNKIISNPWRCFTNVVTGERGNIHQPILLFFVLNILSSFSQQHPPGFIHTYFSSHFRGSTCDFIPFMYESGRESRKLQAIRFSKIK